MKPVHHKELAAGRWNDLSLMEQMANIGSEVERTINWRNKNNMEYSRLAFERSLELLDLTVADQKNSTRLKEILRVREALADHFSFDNIYNTTDQQWQKYFLSFNYAARLGHN
jgi:vacuolar-type H+-ATPase catalytic subunit A/Vma1